MPARANYVHIGIFVVLGIFATLGLAVWLGARTTHRETVTFYTYFNESVQGLDVGAPVTFRGVRIGDVGVITIAPDHRSVEVRTNIDIGAMDRLGLVPKAAWKMGRHVPPPEPDVRAQISSQGLTGTKYVAVDLFDPPPPPPQLSFPVPEHYIPAAKSFSKGLEDSVQKAMDSLTQLSAESLVVVGRVDRLTAELERRHTGEEAAEAVRVAGAVMRDLDRTLTSVDRAGLAEGMGATLADLRRQIRNFGKLMARLDGDTGLVATTQTSVAALGRVGESFTGGTRGLDATLTEIREAAASIRVLADELDRQPDMLVKGRAGGQGP